MARHLTRAELEAGIPHIENSPKDDGSVEAIVVRPEPGQRRDVPSCDVSLAGGVHGDRWAKGRGGNAENAAPHPDVQICIMNSRAIALIAQERANWPPAGDNLFIDLDLRPENLAPGQRLSVGTAILEVTAEPHNGCSAFIERYGRDACVFVNTGIGKQMRLRGIYARVAKGGRISVGDRIRKVS